MDGTLHFRMTSKDLLIDSDLCRLPQHLMDSSVSIENLKALKPVYPADDVSYMLGLWLSLDTTDARAPKSCQNY